MLTSESLRTNNSSQTEEFSEIIGSVNQVNSQIPTPEIFQSIIEQNEGNN